MKCALNIDIKHMMPPPDLPARRGVKRESTVAGGHLMSKEG